MSNASNTTKLSLLDRINVAGIILGVLFAFTMSFMARSWVPFTGIVGFLLAIQIISASMGTVAAILRNKQSWDAFAPLHVAVTVAAFALVLTLSVSVVERITWFNADSIPSVMVAKDYGERYTTNNHRLFKWACATRENKFAINTREINGKVYARCGEWFPQVYTIAAPAEAFEKAFLETVNENAGTPVVIGPVIGPDE